MSAPKDGQTWANLVRPDQEQTQEGPSRWKEMASELAGVGNAAAGWAAGEIGRGTSEFVSRLFGLPENTPGASSPGHQPEHQRDEGMDR